MPQPGETIGERAAAGDGDAAEMSRRCDENHQAKYDHHRLVVQAENAEDQHRDMPDADADAEAEHGALRRRQRGALVRRHDKGRDTCAGRVDQPRKNSDKDDAHHIVGKDNRAGVEKMLVVKVDPVEPQHDADEAAEQRGNGEHFRPGERRSG